MSTLFKNPLLLKFWAHVCSPYLLSLGAHLGRKQEVIKLWRPGCYRINQAIIGSFLCTTFKSWCLISAADVFLINWKNIFLGSSRLSLSLRWEDIEPSLHPPSSYSNLSQAEKNKRFFFASTLPLHPLLKSISSRSTKIMKTASTHWNLPVIVSCERKKSL